MKTAIRGAVAFCSRASVLALALALAFMQAALAAAPEGAIAARPAPVDSTEEEFREKELDEVLVEGYKPTWDQQVLLGWLARLIGKFEVSGTLQFHQPGNNSTLDAKGTADCIGFHGSAAQAVHCDLDVRWPTHGGGHSAVDGLSTFQPAAMLYGYSVDRGFVIRHLLVDSEGKAEGAAGALISPDTMVSRAKCLSGPDACERILRITAGPDLQQVRLEIAIVSEQRTVQTLVLILKRRT